MGVMAHQLTNTAPPPPGVNGKTGFSGPPPPDINPLAVKHKW